MSLPHSLFVYLIYNVFEVESCVQEFANCSCNFLGSWWGFFCCFFPNRNQNKKRAKQWLSYSISVREINKLPPRFLENKRLSRSSSRSASHASLGWTLDLAIPGNPIQDNCHVCFKAKLSKELICDCQADLNRWLLEIKRFIFRNAPVRFLFRSENTSCGWVHFCSWFGPHSTSITLLGKMM